jgi:uncharacterized iron-regulated membrane protein
MVTIRRVLFWLHLSAGLLAGVVILIMSATGVALTYERQLGEWTVRHLRSGRPIPEAKPLSIDELLTVVRRDHPDTVPIAVTMGSRSDSPVVIMAEPAPLYVDAYTGQSLGELGGGRLRAFLSKIRSWHRWLAVDGEKRPIARAVTGWSNALFLFIVVSGLWTWVPRVWTWAQFRNVLLFRRQYGTSKARDFNWHHVIGVWSAIPLFVIVLGAVPISFPWASDLIYRVVGEEPPSRDRPAGPAGSGPAGSRPQALRSEPGAAAAGTERQQGSARSGRGSGPGAAGPRERQPQDEAVKTARGRPPVDGLNRLWERAAAEHAGWRTINLRFPRTDDDPVVFMIDRGDGGQPQLRSTLTLDRAGRIVARETFADQTLGRQIRSVLRFAHTGEVLGIAGQTIAGLASAGAVVMVWTGLALTWRRFRAWVARRHLAPGLVASGTRASTAVSGVTTRPSQESAL